MLPALMVVMVTRVRKDKLVHKAQLEILDQQEIPEIKDRKVRQAQPVVQVQMVVTDKTEAKVKKVK